MDEDRAASVDEPSQWVHLESAGPLVAQDSAPRRRVGLWVLALAAIGALGAGIGIGALVTDGVGSVDEAAVDKTAPTDSPTDADRVRHMVPQWLPDGLQLQSVDDDGYGSGSSCQPSTIGAPAPAATVSGAIPVGPGVCARPTSILRYVSAPLPGADTLSFIQATAADIRSPAPTSPITIRGKNGLLYLSGESVWLAWSEDAETTFFLTSSGLSVADVLRVAESVAVIDAQQWARLRPTSQQSSAVSNGPPGRAEVVACLRAAGLEIPDVPTGAASVVPSRQYPPQAAQAAWQACRDTYVRVSGMPSNMAAQALAVPDCMAAQGWLIVVMSGAPADGAAHSAAMQKCQPVGSMGPPGRSELVACLRTQGLDVPDLPTGPTSVTLSGPYPPDVALAAWQVCRDAYVKASGIPASPLSMYDCMVGHGWIMAISVGPPGDTAAYSAAMQKCQPGGLSASPGRVELAACLRAHGLDVADPANSPVAVMVVQYPPEAAQAAWQACREPYARASGIPSAAMAQALAVPDCMAAQGWLIVAMSGPPTDTTAYNTAMQKCGPFSSGPQYRTQVVACLRAQGLEVPEASTGPGSIVASPHYPADAAQRAWQTCRDVYVRASGMPTSAITQALAVPDCMAAQGWLIVVMSGPPADGSAFNNAMQRCQTT